MEVTPNLTAIWKQRRAYFICHLQCFLCFIFIVLNTEILPHNLNAKSMLNVATLFENSCKNSPFVMAFENSQNVPKILKVTVALQIKMLTSFGLAPVKKGDRL